MLDKEKNKKIQNIKDYDKSDSVNVFYVNGKSAWLDKATRVGLVNSLNMEKSAGKEKSVLYLNGDKIDIGVDEAFADDGCSGIICKGVLCCNRTTHSKC
jgi:hypothetical protein